MILKKQFPDAKPVRLNLTEEELDKMEREFYSFMDAGLKQLREQLSPATEETLRRIVY